MSVNSYSNVRNYPYYNNSNQSNPNKSSNNVSFKAGGYNNDGYSSSVAASYIQKQQQEQKQMDADKQKKDKWKQFGMDVLKGILIGGTLIGGTALIVGCTKAGKEMMQTMTHSFGVNGTVDDLEFKKAKMDKEINYKNCKDYLKAKLAIDPAQQEEVLDNICMANKKIRLERYNGLDIPANGDRGVILYGRGGIGKSYAMEKIAQACGASYLSLNGSDFMNKYQGESERNLQLILNTVKEKAQQSPDEPFILFLDEGESILGNGRTSGGNNTNSMLRSMLLGAMETEGDKALPLNVKFIVTTNYVDDIDGPYRRPGRLGIPMELKCPDTEGQAKIMQAQFEKQFGEAYKNENIKKVIDKYIKNRTEALNGLKGKDGDIQKQYTKLDELEKEFNENKIQYSVLYKTKCEQTANNENTSDIDNQMKEAQDKLTSLQKRISAQNDLIRMEVFEKSNGRFYDFTPAEIKGFVASATKLLEQKGAFNIKNLINVEKAEIKKLIESQKALDEEHQKAMKLMG